MGTVQAKMNGLRNLARVAPHATRSFQTSAPRHGLVSTVGWLGILGTVAGPGIPGVSEKYAEVLAKDEHKTLAWLGGMVVFGSMVKMGSGGGDEAPASDDSADFEAFLKELEAEDKK